MRIIKKASVSNVKNGNVEMKETFPAVEFEVNAFFYEQTFLWKLCTPFGIITFVKCFCSIVVICIGSTDSVSMFESTKKKKL